ncbi:MAG: hypothetical protein A2V70_04930 [Planctomycetes bacterium RBG_13_63_9]|nr:MAG: hypothetical protein A2V70_04930 [Planctomycetes bacterium RBG_13_63_9]
MPGLDEARPTNRESDRISQQPGRFQFSLRGLLASVAVVALICGLSSYWWRKAEEGRIRKDNLPCMCNLKQLGVVLWSYRKEHGCFPPAYICEKNGKPMHSWRVLILPYLESGDLYGKYDFSEPWNGPNNRRLATLSADSIPGVFQCPRAGTKGTFFTNYVAVVGPETMWPGSRSRRLPHGPRSGSQTIMLVEVSNSDIHWMEPRDLTFEQAIKGIQPETGLGISSKHPNGVIYMNADGSVHLMRRDIDPEELRKVLTRDAAQLEVVKARPEGEP